MIKITKLAQEYFLELLSKKTFNTQIRVFVINPGTQYAECKISYCSPQTIKNTDIKLQFDLISIFIDQTSKKYLQNAKIDLITNQLECKLTLTTPNITKQTHKKYNNNATLLKNIENVIESQINPQLQYHGGEIKLIEITQDLFVILKFMGGCNGCSMVSYTLKDAIEKKLLNLFPELKGIKDITEHIHGSHSYY
ncbi:NfuA family Fe-S biogenesis protein [Blochmannia endosymbiont of Polyrhachis (Hedomyrma) turneri]|uniref:NfuA family Fe-S biogenesis protein n=1 Tax=Blochmannia endosymbiont of Polyrhachis (Hedomyrma) turneri TaxID=1505596 RepID=UPI00061A7E9A|nr:NfuA family Fe-S biogenesis protein [Blochmannia endosymbiont of Polyrhachis (Hedomyrma) turneri]AKC60131.1 fe/S biogenesis protein nfuA [Blochmannia endosymbiont of Polyrhachis (Hedomyrma) turneri]